MPPGFISHLDQHWESTAYQRFIRQLAVCGHVIRYDKRAPGRRCGAWTRTPPAAVAAGTRSATVPIA